MADQVKIKVGVEQSGVKTGLAKIRNQFRALKSSAGSAITGAFAGGALASGIGVLIEEASKINDIAERFGMLPSALQRIGNAASQNGSSIEAVGAALNKLALSQDKVRAGDQKATGALEKLKISAKEFINLSTEDAFYRIADSTANAEDRGEAYAAVQQLMGKSSGELFTTLEMNAEAIRQLGDEVGVYSDEAIQRLDELGDSMDKAKGRFAVVGSEGVLLADKVLNSIGAIEGSIAGSFKSLFAGDPSSGFAQWQAGWDTLKEIWNPKAEEPAKKGPLRDVEETAEATREREAKEKRVADLREQLAKLEHDAAFDQLDTQGKINQLIQERKALLEQAAAANAERDPERELTARIKAAKIDGELRDLKNSKGDLKSGMKSEIVADSLTRAGGGGIAYMAPGKEDAAKTAQGIERLNENAQKQLTKLDQIASRIDPMRAPPQTPRL